MLENDAAIADHAREIYLQAGRSHAMPPGNVTQITPEERALLVAWFEEARKVAMSADHASARPHAELPALAGQSPTTMPPTATRRMAGCLLRDGKIAAAGAYAEVSRKAGEGAKTDRPPAASPAARLHRRACAFPADAGDRLLRRRTARLAEQIHLSGRDEIPQRRSTDGASPGCSSTRWCATARRRSPPIARCTSNPRRRFSPRRMSATCSTSPAR